MRPRKLKKKSVVNKLDMAQITALVKLKSNIDKKEKEEENDGCLKERRSNASLRPLRFEVKTPRSEVPSTSDKTPKTLV